ncbi:MAG TPA: hypothetical protein DDZ39_11555 [Flavobacteriaceae bacterium]|nr:hypothetical protein [Flavobacteriaceae bacterium]
MKIFIFKKTNHVTLLLVLFLSCSSTNEETSIEPLNNDFAKIVSVEVSGSENTYTFNVGIQSPDKGCSQYANWWEVLSENGDLIYRRILGHSHVNEQPFVRSGGVVAITKDQIVIVRAHMNNSGYGTQTFKGSVANGFTSFTFEKDFAKVLETQEPLPTGCAF